MALTVAGTRHRRPTDRVRAGVVEAKHVPAGDLEPTGRRQRYLVKTKLCQSHERLADESV